MTEELRSIFKNTARLQAVTLSLFVAACGLSGTRTNMQPRLRNAAVIVDAIELASAFESNELHAVELYGGKRGRINGLFARTEPLSDGRIALFFKTSKETFRPVRCVFDGSGAYELNHFSNGDDVTVSGEIRGFAESSYYVTVEDCVVE